MDAEYSGFSDKEQSVQPPVVENNTSARANSLSRHALTKNDFDRLNSQWISAELVKGAGLFRVSHEDAMEYGFRHSGDLAGLIFPYVDPQTLHTRGYRLRRDNPELEMKGDVLKPRDKYLSPSGQSNFLYFPAGVSNEWLRDKTLGVVVVEGEKKALAVHRLAWHGLGESAEQPHFFVVGISGAWCWKGRRGKHTNGNGKRVDVFGVITDMDRINWVGRKVTLWPDSNFNSNKNVAAGWRGLCNELKRRGAEVRFAFCPAQPGINGPDDALAQHGPEWGLQELRKPWRSNGVKVKSLSGVAPDIPGTGDNSRALARPEVLPTIPESAWSGLVRDYRDLVFESCESPAAYHHSGFFSVARAILAKHVTLSYITEQPVTDFAVNIGRTALARKDTARRFARKLFSDLNFAGSVGYVPGIGSGEGCLDVLVDPVALSNFRDSRRRKEEEDETTEVLPGRSVFMALSEFRTLLAKGRQDFAKATLPPLLNEIWDGSSPIGLPTRTNAFEVEGAYLTILGGSTQEWLSDFLTDDNVHGGFFNRFIFYPGEDSRDLSYPEPPDENKWTMLVNDLNGVVSFWRERRSAVLKVTDLETFAVWDTWYRQFKQWARTLPEQEGAMLARLPDHVMRQAAMYAALDCAEEIDSKHLLPAIDLGAFWEASYIWVSNGGADTLKCRLAQTIKRHLSAKPLRRVELLRKLGGHRDRTQIDQVLKAMLSLSEVIEKQGLLMLVN